MDFQFGHNFIEKIHNFIPSPMYYQSQHLDKNQNPNSIQALSSPNKKFKSSNDKQKQQKQKQSDSTEGSMDTKSSEKKEDTNNNNNTSNINVNYNININFNINVNGPSNNHSSWLPTAPSIQQSSYNNFNNILSQFKNNLSPLIDAANNDP